MAIPSRLHLTSRHIPLRGFQAKLLKRNRSVLAGWEIRLWSDDDNLALIRDVVPQHADAFEALPHGVMRADIARLLYLHVFGGWYADTDYEWLAEPSVPDSYDLVLPVSRESSGKPVVLGNAVLASVAGHPFWRQAVDVAFASDDLLNCTLDQVESATGPGLLTRVGLINQVPERAWLAPREYFHAPDSDDVLGIHHCEGSWRANGAKWRARLQLRRLRRRLTFG